ncbi:hypothetical protein KAM385_33970 [Aeromonas hydrophila]|nr:hypothetical protein KAM385_33970 [Aeromonas hydrophila]
MAESRRMQMEEGGVWNSGMMWRNGGKMDGWHYANSPVDCKIAHDRQPVPLTGLVLPLPALALCSHD